MDRLRTWLVRVVAPVAFVAAAIALVVVVQRALDRGVPETLPPVATAPDTISVTIAPGETNVSTDVGEAQFYRIEAGDTLEAIAVEFGTTVEVLQALNPEITDALSLQPGQRIRVA